MKIFLSYPSEIRPVAEPIAFSLRSRGHSVFFDRDDLPAGKSYDDQIQKAVEQSDIMVYLIAPASVEKGRYTLTEVEFARHAWRYPADRVLPVMIEPTDISKIPTFLKGVTILEPQGNISAEVGAAVDRMRDGGVGLKEAGRAALLCGGIAASLLLMMSWLPLPAIHTVQWPISVIALGGSLATLLYFLSRKLSLRMLLPLPAMLLAFELASPFFFGARTALTPIAVHELQAASPDDTTNEEGRQNRAISQIESWNSVVRSLNKFANWATYGAILMLGALAGTLPTLSAWLSVGRCVLCVAVGAVAAMVAAEIGLTLVNSGITVISYTAIPIGFGLFMASAGGSIAYWHARGRVR